MEENIKGEVAVVETVEVDTKVTELEAKLAKMTEERDNYKTGLLQKKGKLPSEELNNEDVDGLSVADQVELALKNRDIEKALAEKEQEVKRIIRENSELKLALKNQPEGSIGGGGTSGVVEVKDNLLSKEQIEAIKAKAKSANLDPEKFLERFKQNIKSR